MPDHEPLFPALPDNLAELSDDDIDTLLDERAAIAQRIVERDAELIGDRTAGDVIAEMTAGVEAIEQLRNEQVLRAEAADAALAELASLAERAGLVAEEAAPDAPAEDGEAAEDAEEAEVPAEEPAPEAIAASRQPDLSRRLPARRAVNAPSRHAAPGLQTITASADIPGFGMGQELQTLTQIGEAMIARRRGFGSIPPGMSEKVPVARITRHYAEDEILDASDGEGNWSKIEAKTSALVASGGLCAPLTPYYDLQQISSDLRPVRDSLPRFNANRGGIRLAAPPTLASITTGVGVMTAANDAIGSPTNTKTCQHITCPSISDVDVDMIYWCLQFGNLGSRAWPEQVANFTELAMAAHARTAETLLLDGIASKSTAVTGAQVGGAVNTLLGQILTAAAGMRSRHRMAPDTPLRVMLPEWADDMLVTDIIRSQFQRFAMTDSGVEALLRSFNVIPTYYLDGPSGGSQVFGTQTAAALLPYPPTCVWFMFPEGSFLFLDGGTLDLGLVRDSTLNSTNDYSIFGETFENIAFAGIESIKVTSSVCANGEVTLPKTVTCPVV